MSVTPMRRDGGPARAGRLPRAERSERTTELLARAAAAPVGSEERRLLLEDVVTVNMQVADAVAQRHARRGVPTEDLQQVAYLALVRAVQNFDPAMDRDLLSYAVPCMEGELRRYFRDHGWTVRPPRDVQRAHARILGAGHSTDRLDAAGVEKLAADVEESVEVVREALSARGLIFVVSLDQPVGAGELGISELVADPNDEDQRRSEMRLMLAPVLRQLSARDQQVLTWRFVDELTQREIGERLGCSQTQVSKLLQSVLAQLRGALADAG
ncbi:sigma-70 family RNA polymerase sigma factor [Nocardioides nanhaiensis]|uniref:RNA polymerase sigma factor SigF n=1 Tax=Nocardioides nanhaiensis TaxID=1476871 RepID=A0ABP8VUA4_9ACTN